MEIQEQIQDFLYVFFFIFFYSYMNYEDVSIMEFHGQAQASFLLVLRVHLSYW